MECYESYEDHLRATCPDLSEDDLKNELALYAAMEAAEDVAYYTCSCGRTHYVEYVPPPHEYYPRSSICACGHEVVFGS